MYEEMHPQCDSRAHKKTQHYIVKVFRGGKGLKPGFGGLLWARGVICTENVRWDGDVSGCTEADFILNPRQGECLST